MGTFQVLQQDLCLFPDGGSYTVKVSLKNVHAKQKRRHAGEDD